MPALRPSAAFVLLGSLLLAAAPVAAQGDAAAPALTVGSNKLYCHATTDGLTVWMNKLLEDGDEAPYYLTGESAAVVPVLGAGVDPVAQESVEAHIPLSPALAEAVSIGGTVSIQAFIGSGAYGGGVASFAASLMAGTTVLGSADPVEHTMQPHNSNLPGGTAPYEEITWTFTVAETPIPAGTPLEWVISGTVEAGNNVFLACNAARGNSNIDIPVTALAASGNATGNATGNSTSSASGSSSSGPASGTSGSRTSTTSRSATTTTTASSSSETTGNATGDGDGKDSPALPFVALGAALLAAAVATRRQLR